MARREVAGFTQESLAAAVEVDRKTVSRWEHGERVSPWLRPRLASALGISLTDLAALVDDDREQPGEASVVPDEPGEPAPGDDSVTAVSGHRPVEEQLRIAICGSRAEDADADVIDAAVPALARFAMVSGLRVNHGPVGVGIEVMTYMADRYRPADFTMTPSLFGRSNVVRDASYALVIGGGEGTADEVDLTVFTGVRVIPFPLSGGTARRFYDHARRQRHQREWMPDHYFDAFGECRDADEYVRLVRQLINEKGSASP